LPKVGQNPHVLLVLCHLILLLHPILDLQAQILHHHYLSLPRSHNLELEELQAGAPSVAGAPSDDIFLLLYADCVAFDDFLVVFKFQDQLTIRRKVLELE
jgi:hypothetical protein